MSKLVAPPSHLDLKKDHECFKKAIDDFREEAKKIEANTADSAETLKKMHENDTAVAKTLKEMHKDSNEHLDLIAGKKQVPLSIFLIIVAMLSGLIVATEVKYSGVSIDIGWDHIKVSTNK
jgi:hypothetical protein